jgi:hypothetical protein
MKSVYELWVMQSVYELLVYVWLAYELVYELWVLRSV